MSPYDSLLRNATYLSNGGAVAVLTAREIVLALGGHWRGYYGTARCPAHPDRHPSLSIRNGDNGRVLVHCHAGCPPMVVINVLRALGLWPGHSAHGRIRLRANRSCREVKALHDERRIAAAQRIWQQSQLIVGTPGQDYLCSRGVTILPPASLRYAPSLMHGPTRRFLPAIVAGVTIWPSHEIIGVHRIFLNADGQGKAQVSSAKLTLGPSAGGAVRLAPVDDLVWLTEGVEDALSLIQMTGMPAWAVIGTSGFKNLVLPEHITTVILAPDGDEAGQGVIEEAADRLASQGRKVQVARPKAKDWNDALPNFDERAAIMEFDGGHTRQIAEATAGREVAA